MSQGKFPLAALCLMANAVIDKETGEMLEYRHLMKSSKYCSDWTLSLANKFGRLT